MKITKRQLRKIIQKNIFENFQTGNYTGTDWLKSFLPDEVKNLLKRAGVIYEPAMNVEGYDLKIADDVSDTNLSRTDDRLIKFLVSFLEWRFQNYQGSYESPVITSGARSTESQAQAMTVKHQKGEDLFDLYVNRCDSCVELMGGKLSAERKMLRIIEILESGQESMLVDFLETNPVSYHQIGKAIDFRSDSVLLSHLEEYVALEYRGKINVINEQSPPHIHISYTG